MEGMGMVGMMGAASSYQDLGPSRIGYSLTENGDLLITSHYQPTFLLPAIIALDNHRTVYIDGNAFKSPEILRKCIAPLKNICVAYANLAKDNLRLSSYEISEALSIICSFIYPSIVRLLFV